MGNGRRTEEQIARISRATSAAMRRRAERTKCSACGRKNALIRVTDCGFTIGYVCRWCKHEFTGKT